MASGEKDGERKVVLNDGNLKVKTIYIAPLFWSISFLKKSYF